MCVFACVQVDMHYGGVYTYVMCQRPVLGVVHPGFCDSVSHWPRTYQLSYAGLMLAQQVLYQQAIPPAPGETAYSNLHSWSCSDD